MCTKLPCTNTCSQAHAHKCTSPKSVYFPSSWILKTSGMPEGSVPYLNYSHKLELSSGCLVFCLISGNSSFVWSECYCVTSKLENTISYWQGFSESLMKMLAWSDICRDYWLWPQVSAEAESIRRWGMDFRFMWDTSAGYAGTETKEKKKEERGRRRGDKLLRSLATRCLKCWSALLSASGFSLSLLHSSLRLSQHGTHLICHTGLRQLSLNTSETWTKIQMSLTGFTLFQWEVGAHI